MTSHILPKASHEAADVKSKVEKSKLSMPFEEVCVLLSDVQGATVLPLRVASSVCVGMGAGADAEETEAGRAEGV